MKNVIGVLIAITIVFLMQSCIPSLHPLYTADKKVYLEQLEGIWSNFPMDVQLNTTQTETGSKIDAIVKTNDEGAGRAEVWNFRKNDSDGYLLIHQDNDGFKAAFEVNLVKLDGAYFMDFYPTDMPEKSKSITDIFKDEKNDMLAYHLLPVHTFAKLVIEKDEIKIKLFDPDFLDKLLNERKVRIKHEALTDGGFVLTAQPEELQKFVEKYASNEELYINEVIALEKVD